MVSFEWGSDFPYPKLISQEEGWFGEIRYEQDGASADMAQPLRKIEQMDRLFERGATFHSGVILIKS